MKAAIFRYDDETALFEAAAARWAELAREAVARHGAFHVALSGGTTPRRQLELLARRDDLPWDKIHLWIGDERCVPQDHEESNYRMAREALIDHVPVPAAQVHPMVESPDHPADDAARYERLLNDRLPTGGAEIPRFDLVMLGLGPDGHFASLFPGGEALGERHRWVVANWVERLGVWRVTLTYPVIEEARHLQFLVTGADKAGPVARALAAVSEGDEEPLPVERIEARGEVEWFLDAAAAAELGVSA